MIEIRKVMLVCLILVQSACGENDQNQSVNRRDIPSTRWDVPAKVVYTPPHPVDVEIKDEGNVVVYITINTNGFVDTARIERSSKHAYLDSLALDSIRKTVWKPAIKDGNPVAMQVSIPYMFRIRPDTATDQKRFDNPEASPGERVIP